MFKAKVLGRAELTARLAALVPEAEKQAEKAKLEVAQEAAMLISARAPADTGEYRNEIVGGYQRDHHAKSTLSMQKSKDPDATGVFGPFIWRFLEFGSRAHMIKAKPGEKLAFKTAEGESVFTRGVRHPGTPAQPHIFPTWRAYKPKAKRKIANAINKAVRAARKKG
ncbi:HK97 gp10 family phage protein [Agrobacterium rhizogenes]|uniref:HK97-gp10 family putative phage morphogenesis protein n=1 Tax=Rhizobium rhizogenes TaxID=359 RepID=UPI001572DCD6|nr:HK97-gp10 family putative phage morphogenesis protein [Rhizobium rhizogenes]NTG48972.1 HK97 gp10 family phage protein [Rhizobium rhizogenes]